MDGKAGEEGLEIGQEIKEGRRGRLGQSHARERQLTLAPLGTATTRTRFPPALPWPAAPAVRGFCLVPVSWIT